MHTIRGKIRIAYLAFALVVGTLSLLALLDLHFLDQRIEQGALIAQLKEDGLEMRRQEKNFFLYQDEGSRLEAMRLANEMVQTLAEAPMALTLVSDARERNQLHTMLLQYLQHFGTPGVHSQAETVREAGHGISERLASLAERERTILRASITQSQRVLLFSIAAMLLLAVSIGWLLSRAVVEPLRQLEQQLEPIAAGRFNALQIKSGDKELVSFAQAINRMLDELETRRRQLLHSEKLASLGVLVSGVAHELNNPLSNISSSAQLLAEELDSAPPELQREWLQQIDEQIDRARNIVRSLLEFSRDTPFESRPVVVATVVNQSISFLRRQISGHLQLETDVAEDCRVVGDAQRLQQVFINLLKNAADASAPGTPLRISARHRVKGEQLVSKECYLFGNEGCTRQGSGEFVVISVEDTGPGIDAETLPKIFDPFFTTKGVGHGMGLGLYVVLEIVEEHKGCIAVESKPGEGTRFLIILPEAAPGAA